MCADEYSSTPEEGIVKDIQEVAGNEPWVLAHDGAPSHRAKKTTSSFRLVTQQPGPKPDSKHLGMMKQEIQRQEPKTEETWLAARRKLGCHFLGRGQTAVGSVGRRLSAVVASQGDHTKS